MPYIEDELRALFNGYIKTIENVVKRVNNSTKIMAYVIYKLVKDVYGLGDWDWMANGLKVLEDVKLEFYRRVLAPHADKKIEEKGDI